MKAIRMTHLMTFAAGCAAAWALAAMTGGEAVAQDDAQAGTETAKDERFFMLNALWFKPDGGAEKYAEYMAAAGPITAKYGAKSDGAYIPEANLIGEFDADLLFFVEWPDEKSFTTFIADPDYQAVSHLRGEAIRDSLLIRCKRMEP